MSERQLNVTNIEDVELRVRQLSEDEDFTIDCVDFSKTLYITNTCASSKDDNKDARYVWIDTDRTHQGHRIYISLFRPKSTDDYRGGYVGTALALIRQTPLESAPAQNKQRLLDKCRIEAPVVTDNYVSAKTCCDSVTASVQNLLLINYWSSCDGLNRYIKTVGGRLTELVINKTMTECYLLNSLNDAVVNTGLLDKYGNAICLMYRLNRSANNYIVDRIIDSKRSLIEAGFPISTDLCNIRPLTFMNDDDYIEEISMDCFDLSNRSLQHIVEERMDRLPESISQSDIRNCAVTINDCIRRELAIWVCDHMYARPVYNAKAGKVVWYLPLHINKGLSCAPELIALFVKDKELGIYCLKTILPYDDDIKDSVLALNLYNPWRWEE